MRYSSVRDSLQKMNCKLYLPSKVYTLERILKFYSLAFHVNDMYHERKTLLFAETFLALQKELLFSKIFKTLDV